MAFLARSGSNLVLSGQTFKNIGFNYYPAFVDTISSTTLGSLYDAARKREVKLFRHWAFDSGQPPTNTNGNFRYLSGTQLVHRGAALQQLHMMLNEARKRGIKLVLSLADNTTNYNTKSAYVTWANAIYGSGLSTSYPYVGFFDSSDCRQLYLDNFSVLANSRNPYNGLLVKDDDTVAWWELGNELRYDVFDAESGTQNTAGSTNIAKVMNWADYIAGQMKTIDANHLISFSSVGHAWKWTQGDTVANGSGYGACYLLFPSLVNVDILDFHTYPTQGGGETQLLEYGQHLGYADAITGEGYRAQLRDFVTKIKAGNKIAVCGEVGFVREVAASTTYFPLYPRHNALKEIITELVNAGVSAVLPWSATISGGGSYSIGLSETGTSNYWGTNANSNDSTLMTFISQMNTKLMHPGQRSLIV